MKKFLTRVFSVVLVAATVASPSMAQLAKKAVAPKANAKKALVTEKAQAATAKSALKGDKGIHQLPVRTVGSSSAFKSAKGGKAVLKTTNIAKENAAVPTIYGSVIYNDTFAQGNEPVGMYKLPSAAGATELLYLGPDAMRGGVCVDNYYYTTSYSEFFGMIISIDVYVYDTEAGELVGSYESETIEVIASGGYALDPTSGQVYGVTFNAAGNALQLSKLNFTESSVSVEAVAPIEGSWNSIAFDSNGQLYGISYEVSGEDVVNTTLKKIDKTNASLTTVGATGVDSQYMSSSTIDTKTNKMYWNVCSADETGNLYEVNLSTGVATFIYQLNDNDEIMGMYIPKPAAEDKAPAACENVEVVFNANALAGTVELTAPAKLYDGSNGSGALTIKVLVDGEEVGSKAANWGEEVSIPVSVTEAGNYTFVVYATNATGDGPKSRVSNIWVGADTPSATKATLVYEEGNMVISWNAVAGSVNGGYVDYDNLTYKVVRADGTVAAQGLKALTFSEAVAEPESFTVYYYTVYAEADGLQSAPAMTNKLALGDYIPPFTTDLATVGLDGWTIIDANGDGNTWSINNGNLRARYSSSANMDDWAITPAIKLEAGKAYNVTFEAWAYNSTWPERLEVKYGKAATVEAMTSTLIEPTVIPSAEHLPLDGKIIPDEDGYYYIGLHGISDANMFYLDVSNITVEAGTSALAPGLASDFVVTPDPTGAFKATVAFKTPATTMNNKTLTELTKVELLRDGEVIKTYNNPGIGAAISYEDNLTEGGTVNYSVIGYNSVGQGLKANMSTFVGFDVPLAPASVSISRTSTVGEVVTTWEAVTADVNGKPLGANDVTYIVAENTGNGWSPVAQGITGTSYTEQAVEPGKQDFIERAVFAVNSIGNGQGTVSEMIPVGTPYDGISESFADGTPKYLWGITAIGSGTVSIYTDEYFEDMTSSDSDNGFIGVRATYLDQGAYIFSGLITLERMINPGLTFDTFNITGGDSPDINEVSVDIAVVNGTETGEWVNVYGPKTVVDIVGEGVEGWGKVTVSLEQYAGKTIQFRVCGITKCYVNTFFDNFKVYSMLDHNLKAGEITAPASVKAGEGYNVNVTVINEGAQAAAAYSVELYCDDELVATENLTNLAAGEQTTVTFERIMSGVATEPLVYFAKIVYAEDENELDNQTANVTVAPVLGTLPGATELAGTSTKEGVKLTWNEPNLDSPANAAPAPITEDFEDADGVQSEYGDWTFVDVDGDAVGGFQSNSGQTLEIPGITVGATTGSFWTWDNDVISWANGNPSYEAHSGSKYLFALFNYEGSNSDDWAISPALYGGEQTISFYAKSYSGQYPEQIEVYYSTGGKEISDFVAVPNSNIFPLPNSWTQYSYTLPAGAVYFAIRSYGQNAFMLMIDDVTFIPGEGSGAKLNLLGYNVYRNGVKINDSLVEETEYVDTNVVEGERYTYIVTAVYENRGESALSNECVVTYSTVGVDAINDGAVKVTVEGQNIVVLNANDLNVTVAAVNGAVVYNGVGEAKTVVTVGSGVYVVKAGNTVKKVAVK